MTERFEVYGVVVECEVGGDTYNHMVVEEALSVLPSLQYGTAEYRDAYRKVYDICDRYLMNDIDWDLWYSLYMRLNAIEDKKYYDYAIEDFREFESHKGEPDFDWGFYSDWHKDLYGYRPKRA